MADKLILATIVGLQLLIITLAIWYALRGALYIIYRCVGAKMPFDKYAYKVGCNIAELINDIIERIFKW